MIGEPDWTNPSLVPLAPAMPVAAPVVLFGPSVAAVFVALTVITAAVVVRGYHVGHLRVARLFYGPASPSCIFPREAEEEIVDVLLREVPDAAAWYGGRDRIKHRPKCAKAAKRVDTATSSVDTAKFVVSEPEVG